MRKVRIKHFMYGCGALLSVAMSFMPNAARAMDEVVKSGSPASINVLKNDPSAANAKAGFLTISVKRFKPPSNGQVEAVVLIPATEAAPAQELGRFSFFPNQPFEARSVVEEQRFMLMLDGEASQKIGLGIPVVLKLAPIAGSASQDAMMIVGGVQLEKHR